MFLSRQHQELIRALVDRELKGRYKGSVLGVLWSILTPLFMAIIYVFFFRMLIGRGVPTEGIIIGVFAWQFTIYSMNTGMMCITGNSNLIKKVKFPRILLPTAVAISGLVDYLISLVVQLVILGVLLSMKGSFFPGDFFWLPVVLLLHLLFNLSLALMLSAANVYFRDTQHFVGVFTSAWFFISPIMYDLDFVRSRSVGMEWIADWFMLNPLAVIITLLRSVMLPDVSFDWSVFSCIGLGIIVVFFVAALAVFRKSQKNFADFV